MNSKIPRNIFCYRYEIERIYTANVDALCGKQPRTNVLLRSAVEYVYGKPVLSAIRPVRFVRLPQLFVLVKNVGFPYLS